MKKTPYFSHDANSRRDRKMVSMMMDYGVEGYGRFWILIEMMREENGFKLRVDGNRSYEVIASELKCSKEDAEKFINDCVQSGLFRLKNKRLSSSSFLSRMNRMKDIEEKRRQAAIIKHSREGRYMSDPDANAVQMHGK